MFFNRFSLSFSACYFPRRVREAFYRRYLLLLHAGPKFFHSSSYRLHTAYCLQCITLDNMFARSTFIYSAHFSPFFSFENTRATPGMSFSLKFIVFPPFSAAYDDPPILVRVWAPSKKNNERLWEHQRSFGKVALARLWLLGITRMKQQKVLIVFNSHHTQMGRNYY